MQIIIICGFIITNIPNKCVVWTIVNIILLSITATNVEFVVALNYVCENEDVWSLISPSYSGPKSQTRGCEGWRYYIYIYIYFCKQELTKV